MTGFGHFLPFTPRRVSATGALRSSHMKSRRLFLAHPAIINPDRKETEKTGTEIPGRSVEIIHSRFNNTKTQDVWILLADE